MVSDEHSRVTDERNTLNLHHYHHHTGAINSHPANNCKRNKRLTKAQQHFKLYNQHTHEHHTSVHNGIDYALYAIALYTCAVAHSCAIVTSIDVPRALINSYPS